MAEFVFKTRTEDTDVKGKPRVYFTCHPDDFICCFDKIAEDIFKTHDCVIYYTSDMTEEIEQKDLEATLGQMNLFVVAVTEKLLKAPCRAMNFDIAYAKREHIPILPFMMEMGLDALYSKPEKFDTLQYLSMFDADLTAISYEKKLKKYLDSVLISDELSHRVRAAFDAYVFLSYRKKDRKYANELMRIIHKNPECRDIAIWYDEFLTPGESFTESIERALADSKIFALLVTPSLLEEPNGKPNFVMAEEYPAAIRAGKEILPAEMVGTEHNVLVKKFNNIPDCTDPRNEVDFKNRLLQAIEKAAITSNDHEPEHNFLIGLAYLEGIDVEVDRKRGIKLITSAAEAGLLEAIEKLYRVYSEGDGALCDNWEAKRWAEKLYNRCITEYGEEHIKTLSSLRAFASALQKVYFYANAVELFNKAYAVALRIYGEENELTLDVLLELAAANYEMTYTDTALDLYGKAYSLQMKMHGEENTASVTILRNMARINQEINNYPAAAELYEKAYKIQSKLFGEEHFATRELCKRLSSVRNTLQKRLDILSQKEKEYFSLLAQQDEESRDVRQAMRNLAKAYKDTAEYEKAVAIAERLYNICARLYGENNEIALADLGLLGEIYHAMGEYDKALVAREKRYKSSLSLNIIAQDELNELTETYIKRNRFDKIDDFYNKIYELVTNFGGSKEDAVYKIGNDVCAAYIAAGNHGKAFEMHQAIYEMQCEKLGKAHPDAMKILLHFASYNMWLRNRKKALELYEELYGLQSKNYGESSAKSLQTLEMQIPLCLDMENIEKAIEIRKKHYSLMCEEKGEDNTESLVSLESLASFQRKIGDYCSAAESYEKLFVILHTTHGEEYSDTLSALKNCAECYSLLDNYKNAAAYYAYLMNLQKKLLGDTHKDFLASQSAYNRSLGLLKGCSGLTENQALAQIQEVISQLLYGACRENQSEEDLKRLNALKISAYSHFENKKWREAVEAYEKAYSLQSEVFGPECSGCAEILMKLVYAYDRLGKDEKTKEYAESAYRLCQKNFGERHPYTLEAMRVIANRCCFSDNKDCGKAIELSEKRYRIYLEMLGEENRKTRMELGGIEFCYRTAAEDGCDEYWSKAIEASERFVDLQSRVLGEKHPDTFSALHRLGLNLKNSGNYKKAAKIFKRMLDISIDLNQSRHDNAQVSRVLLAESLRRSGDYKQALEIQLTHYEVCCEIYGEESSDANYSRECLAHIYEDMGENL